MKNGVVQNAAPIAQNKELDFYFWKSQILAFPKKSEERKIAFAQALGHAENFGQLRWLCSLTMPNTPERNAVLRRMLVFAETKQELWFIWSKTTSESPIEYRVLVKLVRLIKNPLDIQALAGHVVKGANSIKIIDARLSELGQRQPAMA